jgi:hypothetical protein
LQDLAKYIDPDDVQLLEWAGVEEFGDFRKGLRDKKDKVKGTKALSDKQIEDQIRKYIKNRPQTDEEELEQQDFKHYKEDIKDAKKNK